MRHNRHDSSFANLDRWSILIYIALVLAGWVSIYGASFDYESAQLWGISSRAQMQICWISTSALLAFLICYLNRHTINQMSYLIYGAMMALLLLTIFIAPEIKGSRSWIAIGSIRLQPAEFAKIATALALARLIAARPQGLHSMRDYIAPTILLLLPMTLILAQNETGSALVFTAFAIPLYREGMPRTVISIGALMAAIFIVTLKFTLPLEMGGTLGETIAMAIALATASSVGHRANIKKRHRNVVVPLVLLLITGMAIANYYYALPIYYTLAGVMVVGVIYYLIRSITHSSTRLVAASLILLGSMGMIKGTHFVFNEVMQPHQQKRILLVLGETDDPRGIGYNVNQSKIAIGSGGLWGKGLLNGTQTKLKYVPEQDTDFIFCTVGEEHGFVGGIVVLGLYFTLIARIFRRAEAHYRSPFVRIYGYSVGAILLFHMIINVGMVMGLLPVIGIPLPFFSYGGSSLWGFTILLFLFLKLDADTPK